MKLADVKHRLNQLTIKDWRDIERAYKRAPMDEAKEFSRGLPTDSQGTVFSIAAAQGNQRNLLSDEGLQWMLTLEGSSLLIFKSLSSTDPSLQYESLMTQLTYDDMTEITQYILEVNNLIRKPGEENRPTEEATKASPSPNSTVT